MNTDNKKIRESALEWFNEISKTKAYWVAVCKSQNVLISESEIIEMYLSEHPQETKAACIEMLNEAAKLNAGIGNFGRPQETKEKSTAVIEGLEDAAKYFAEKMPDATKRYAAFKQGAQWLHDTRYLPLLDEFERIKNDIDALKYIVDLDNPFQSLNIKTKVNELQIKVNKFINK